MSRTLALVLALTLILPVALFIIVAEALRVNPDFIKGGFLFLLGAGAFTAMMFEIKRLADT